MISFAKYHISPNQHMYHTQDAQNDNGDTALHWAMRAGRRGLMVVKVLLENSARATIMNHAFRRPLDVAADGFSDDNTLKKRKRRLLLEERRDTRCNLFTLSAQSRSLVLYHPECLEHIPKSESDWEVPDRVSSIVRRIIPSNNETTGVFPYEVTVTTEFEKATLELLSRVHSDDYLVFVNDLSKELSKREDDNELDVGQSSSVVPFTPMVCSMLRVSSVRASMWLTTSYSSRYKRRL